MNNNVPDYILDDKTINKKTGKKYLILFYSLVILVSIYVYYLYRIDKYEFYLFKDSIIIDNGSSYKVEITPKNSMYFDYSNYKFDIVDKNVAIVDEYGNVTGINNGKTKLKVKYKNGFQSKTMNILVENIDVKSIETQDKIELSVNDSSTINTKINNQKNVKVDLTYESIDSDVVTVDGYGNVNANKAGETTITVSSDDGATKEIQVLVNSNVKEIDNISFADTEISLKKGNRMKLVPIINPSDIEKYDLSWSSNNNNVIVDNSGNIIASNEGTSIITVTSKNGKKASCNITVKKEEVNSQAITLNINNKQMQQGETLQLIASISPTNATNRELKWSSTNTKVATVVNGKVTAIGVGEATITVTSSNGVKNTCLIIVKQANISPSSIQLNNSNLTLDVESSYTLTANVLPTNVTNKTVIWSSSNSNIVSVESGKVTALQAGTAIITATTANGKSANCTVVVYGEEEANEDVLSDVDDIDDPEDDEVIINEVASTISSNFDSSSIDVVPLIYQYGQDMNSLSNIISIAQTNPFRINSKINAKLIKKKDISNVVSSARTVQGMCTDGRYFYMAFMTKTNYKVKGAKKYTDQSTILVKLDLNGKVISKINVGKIGHSNGLAYNPVTKKIIFAPCNKYRNYIYQISSNFNKNTQKEKVILKNGSKNFITDSNGKVIRNVASLSFNEKRNEILVKCTNRSIAVFDPYFNFKRMITVSQSLKNSSNLTGQSIYTEGDYIYSVFNNMKVNPHINYLNVYDYNTGNLIKTITLGKKISDIKSNVELESIVKIGNKYYVNGNYNGNFLIIKLALLNS